ncbi:hypothetical protein PFMC_00855, partial [Plasmodium falciparum CAMP/Malaysia]
KKTKHPVDLFSVIDIPKSDYDIPTLKSSNRYIPYASDRYKGKTYIYMEGDSSGDEKYAFMSDTTDITSSESEPNDIPNDYTSGDIPMNTQPNTLYFDNNQEKPFITSIHDRNLLSGEEYNYDMSNNSGNNDLYSGIDPTSANHDSYSGKHGSYSGIDLINDALNGDYDIYDEMLKRKENELFGTKHHTKRTSTQNVAKPARDDPIHNQLDLFHKWLDRHRDMCEQWNKNKKEELLDKLKEEWNKKNNNNSDLTHTSSNIPSGENSIKNVLNTDVSIQIDMDDPKPINEFTNMDNIIDNLEKNSGPYYDIDEDDIIYFDIDDERTPMDQNNMDNNKSNVPTKVQIEMNVINKQELFQEEFPISDIWNI